MEERKLSSAPINKSSSSFPSPSPSIPSSPSMPSPSSSSSSSIFSSSSSSIAVESSGPSLLLLFFPFFVPFFPFLLPRSRFLPPPLLPPAASLLPSFKSDSILDNSTARFVSERDGSGAPIKTSAILRYSLGATTPFLLTAS